MAIIEQVTILFAYGVTAAFALSMGMVVYHIVRDVVGRVKA